MWRKVVYNGVKFVVGISAVVMSVEYYYFWVQWHNYYYILDLIAWFIYGGIMLGEAIIAITKSIA